MWQKARVIITTSEVPCGATFWVKAEAPQETAGIGARTGQYQPAVPCFRTNAVREAGSDDLLLVVCQMVELISEFSDIQPLLLYPVWLKAVQESLNG